MGRNYYWKVRGWAMIPEKPGLQIRILKKPDLELIENQEIKPDPNT